MKIDLDHINSLLIIQIRPFGDVLLNTAYLPFLRERLPHARIDFLVKHPFQDILYNNPYIDGLVVFGAQNTKPAWLEKLRLFATVRRNRYDLIIDQIQGTTSAQIVLASGAKYRISSTETHWRYLYNIRVSYKGKRYSASMKFDLLQPLGISESSYRLDYTVRPASVEYIWDWLEKQSIGPQPLICMSPGSPRKKKKWDADCYAELADLIIEKTDRKLVLLWGPEEKKDVEKVRKAMRHQPLLAPPTDYNQAAALLKVCGLLICNDGGLNHLAVATETPSLAIFGNTSPQTWSPEGIFPHHYHLYNPNWKKMSDNRFGITPEEAFQKVLTIMEQIDMCHQ